MKTLVIEEVDDDKVPSAPVDLEYTASTKISGVTVTVNVKNTVSDDVLDLAIAALDEAGYTNITAIDISIISATKGKVTRIFDVERNDAYKVTFTSTQTLSVNLHNYSNFSPYFFINILCGYVRLALVNVLLVCTLAVWRVKREEKKADVIRQ